MLVAAMSRSETIEALRSDHHGRDGQFIAGVSRTTAHRYVAAAQAELNRDARKLNREGWLSTGIAQLQRVIRTALTTKKAIVVAGQIQYVDAPDLDAIIRAVNTISTMTGVDAPERKTYDAELIEFVLARYQAVIRETVVDPLPPAAELVSILFRRLREAASAAIEQREEVVVVDARPVEHGPTAPYIGLPKPKTNGDVGSNGTNGYQP